MAEGPLQLRESWREHRTWSRERQAALRLFYKDLGLWAGAPLAGKDPQTGRPGVLDAVTQLRGGRPIKIDTVPLDSLSLHVSGAVVVGDDHDTIVVSSRVSRRHRVHVILHEVRHLLVDDGPTDGPGMAVHRHFDGVTIQSLEEQMQALPPRLREELLTRPVKLRAGYPDDEELTCEVFARAVLPLLDLDPAGQSLGPLAAAFSNRRTI
ncbi:hypothetical protein [Streptomyces sp. NPDC029554]|uniref:hypothetical protein n=1 Tax=Streptomyces sp. NPDC029554 TaxID=3155126 RepID=UPI00340272CB